MNKRIAIAFCAAGLLAVASGFAADKAPQPQKNCAALEKQFDEAIATRGMHEKAAQARKLRQEGAKLCASGKSGEGMKKLDQALADIGVQAK